MKNDMKSAAALAVVSITLTLLFAFTGSLTSLAFSYLFLIGSTVIEYQCGMEQESRIKVERVRKQYQVQQERDYWQYREEATARSCARLREEAS